MHVPVYLINIRFVTVRVVFMNEATVDFSWFGSFKC